MAFHSSSLSLTPDPELHMFSLYREWKETKEPVGAWGVAVLVYRGPQIYWLNMKYHENATSLALRRCLEFFYKENH